MLVFLDKQSGRGLLLQPPRLPLARELHLSRHHLKPKETVLVLQNSLNKGFFPGALKIQFTPLGGLRDGALRMARNFSGAWASGDPGFGAPKSPPRAVEGLPLMKERGVSFFLPATTFVEIFLGRSINTSAPPLIWWGKTHSARPLCGEETTY